MSGIERAGFADPVLDAQACFRAVLDAMARPGTIRTAGEMLVPPAPLAPAAAAVLLTLADAETRLWLDPDAAPAREWIAFHCGASIASGPGAVQFALALALPDFAELDAGTDEAPEAGATLILQVAALGTGERYRLSGPGLSAPARLAVAGLPASFPAMWSANHARFPRGVDLVLCAGPALAALPRSTAIEAA